MILFKVPLSPGSNNLGHLLYKTYGYIQKFITILSIKSDVFIPKGFFILRTSKLAWLLPGFSLKHFHRGDRNGDQLMKSIYRLIQFVFLTALFQIIPLNGCSTYQNSMLYSGLAAIPVNPEPPTTWQEKHEMRAAWVVGFRQMTSSASIDKVVEWARIARLNTLFVQVRVASDAYYKSKIVPRSEELKEQSEDFDPLGYMLKKGHEAGLKIHAYLNLGIVWRRAVPPVDKDHIFNKQPNWILRDATGKMSFPDEYDPTPSNVENYYWVNWSNPFLQEHLARVVDELIETYDVDGVHLDFVRYPARMGAMTPPAGYNPGSVDRFRSATGREPLDNTKAWDRWRTEQVGEVIKKIHDSIKGKKPALPLSAAVLAAWDLAYGRQFTDYRAWLDRGYLDFAVLMCYYKDMDRISKRVFNAREVADARRIVLGVGLYLNPPDVIADQLLISRNRSLKGFALFSLDTASMPKPESYLARLRYLAIPDVSDGRYEGRDPVWSRVGVIDAVHRKFSSRFFSRNGRSKLVIYQRRLESL